MSVLTGVLGMGRAQAAMRFTETLTAFYTTRVLGSDGLYTDTEVPLYSGIAGQVKFPTLTVSEREQGAQVPAMQDVMIKVATASTPLVAVNHIWRVTASTADASLVGREFRTKGLPQSGQTTSWRYPVEAAS